MDIPQRYLYCSQTFFYIGTYIIHLWRNDNERIVQTTANQLPEDSFLIECDDILLPSVYEPYRDLGLHTSNQHSSVSKADCKNVCVNPDQPVLRTCAYGTPCLDTCLPRKPSNNNQFDTLATDIDQWSPYSGEEEY